MKKLRHESFSGSNIYFTEADASSQAFYGTTWDEFSASLKLWLLIADRVFLSTGHMLRSSMTFGWLEQERTGVEELAEKNVLVPSLSDQYTSCRDFAEDQVSDSALWRGAARGFRLSAVDRGRFLDDLFPTAITWSSAGESNWFKRIMHSHLCDKSSPLRSRLFAVPHRSFAALADAIAACEDFRRGTLRALVQRHCPRYTRFILRYADCYYYLSGASTKDAMPLMHSDAASLCRDQVGYAVERNASVRTNEVWRTVMDDLSVSSQSLVRMPLTDVVELRESEIGQRARVTFGRLMNSAKTQVPQAEDTHAVHSVMEHFFRVLNAELARQRRRHRMWGLGGSVLAVTGWATSTIGTILGAIEPTTGLALGLLGTVVGAPIKDTVERRVGDTELILLANEMRRRRVS